MRRLLRPLATLAAISALLVACAKVQHTGRKQFNILPDSLMRGLGKTSYKSMLGNANVKKKGEDNDVLQKVGRKISRVADQPKYDWQFSLINSKDVNAWCLPGGYIGFYSGILPVLESEAGMAFVMGHEVGHATAHHGAERLTQQLTMVGGLIGLELYLKDNSKLDGKQRAILLGALGVGGTVGVILPFSRMHESEADVIGMMYMAKAGYPPAESIKVWDRMAKASKGGMKLPAFLSTHPTTKKRQQNQKEWLPRARKRYQRNALQYDTLRPLWGKDATGGGARGGNAGRGDQPATAPRGATQGAGTKKGGGKKKGKGKGNGGSRRSLTSPVFMP